MSAFPIHAKITGPIVMIGFGSIGKGTLPLIERHFDYDPKRFVIIDPHEDGELAKKHNVRFIKQAVTKDNYRELLKPLLSRSEIRIVANVSSPRTDMVAEFDRTGAFLRIQQV